ncbi:SDR family oxidoreductase [Alicyclobacillus acidoterrestris]|uniref:Enoyl-[acyl-carrier-protein] reductase [NADH] n=1 Tax=Alicyclobacillus acidoterrestris (strain ATCC 49025 / DSM 3922 / CIP 106132 / NCIMB 13137 / GD3B) TaxID=1356854 RepID=T0C906_ALIAG|nr:SDR family oxidoreductase [Alicyclobacillus acidoterrestris]EPZ52658.1 3-ketoacyl-ACP reductase [Alicyclobacillus acidoterrestris ATCC 49025]UNO48616.1 SDR family oxidoreductase [Alicyclobacillus acidoterrestris]
MAGLLEGKKAFITGSGRGIGRATALAMAREGADVVVHYRRDKEQAEATAKEIQALGRQALTVKAELESQEEINAAFDVIEQEWGSLDIFVANAAASAFKPIDQLKDYHLDKTYHVVVHSTVFAAQRCIPLMEGRNGRIITMSSMGSTYTLPRYATLGSAKAALESLTRYLASELGPKGITVNALNPGVVDTESAKFYGGDNYDQYNADVIAHTPLGRIGTVEEIADAAVFLASDLSRFITGQVIRVDGGLTLMTGGFESF